MKNFKELAGGAAVGALAGTFIGFSASAIGWLNFAAVIVVLLLAIVAVRAVRRANAKHEQINRESLDPRDPPTDTTGETR